MEEFKPWGMELKSYILLMHLSQLAGFAFPGAGLAMPIIMWATNKEHSDEIDQHGKMILNWMISLIIYSIVSFILIFVFVGVFMLLALMLINLIFVIIGAINANDGKLWVYPLSIPFFKL